MSNSYRMTLLFVLISYVYIIEAIKIKFSNLRCDEFDRPFATFRNCTLKALARDTVALYMYIQLHQVPITNISVNAALFQRGNGYRPLLYNSTIDYCKFLKNKNAYMFWNIVYTVCKPYTNANHSCPFNHDIIVDRLILDSSMLRRIPFPSNDYMIALKFAAYDRYRAEARFYITIYD